MKLSSRAGRFSVGLLPQYHPDEDACLEVRERVRCMAVLADGNNRSGGNYNKGGANVVRVAEELLSGPGDLHTFVAFIVSPENAAKRGEDFFVKMWNAFLKLGIGITTKGFLGGRGIRLSYEGDLDALPSMPAAQEFLEMARAVQRVNEACLAEAQSAGPPKELVLGIHYSRDALQQRGVQFLYRSGMEERGVGRFGSTEPNADVLCVADETLWPDVDTEHLRGLLSQSAGPARGRFDRGYSGAEIQALLEAAQGVNFGERGLGVHIPFSGALEDLGALRARAQAPSLPAGLHVSVFPESDVLVRPMRAIVAPGQTGATFRFPRENPFPPGYANIFHAQRDPRAVVQGIRQALEFSDNHASLKGAKREVLHVSSSPKEAVPVEFLEEFADYHLWKARLLKESGDVLRAAGMEPGEDVLERYNRLADVFVSKILLWVDTLEVRWRRDVEFRALLNYIFTCFFLAAAPVDSESAELVEGWEARATMLSRYMVLVYLMDDRLYDIPAEAVPDKARFIELCTRELEKAVRLERLQPVGVDEVADGDLRNTFSVVVNGFQDLARDLHQLGDPALFAEWQHYITQLFRSHRDEWSSAVVDNRAVAGLDTGNCEAFLARYEKLNASDFFVQKVRAAFDKLKNQDDQARAHARAQLELFAYLCDIENSIGSAHVYRTLACMEPPRLDTAPELAVAYQELCFLINIYFRLANDLAEVHRAVDDREGNVDSGQIMYRSYIPFTSRAEAVIYSAGDVYRLVREFKAEIMRKRQIFQRMCRGIAPWEAVARAIVRSDIGELYYDGTHYREARRPQVRGFFEALYGLGT